MTKKELAGKIDHTLLSPLATGEEIKKLCREALEAGFATVCVQPGRVALAKRFLEGSDVGITTVVGFPQGAGRGEVKAYEARLAIEDGADEIDMVINLGALREGDWETVRRDIRAVREASRGHVLKVILESADLSDEEIVAACRVCDEEGCDFVKTSTGFGGGGASESAVRLMRGHFSGNVKASGGIRTLETAQRMIEAGASRLGASAGMAILGEIEE